MSRVVRIDRGVIVDSSPVFDNARVPGESTGRTWITDCAVFGWSNAVAHGVRYSPAWDPGVPQQCDDASQNSDGHIVPFGYASDLTADALVGIGKRAV
jgi:hypothetical protein